MKTKHVPVAVLSLFGILFLSVAVSAQDTNTLSPVQQGLYDIGFGIFSQEVEAPDFSARILNGPDVSLRDYRGKVVVLNLWATWCPPCRAEMPSMQDLYDTLNPRGFEILAVAAPSPPRETLEKIADFVDDYRLTFPVLIDEDFSVNGIYGTGSIPTSYVIDRQGKLVARLTGAIDWHADDVVAIFSEMLAQ